MAGEWMLDVMKGKGGKDSDYSDVVFGTVVATGPLQIQIGNNMILSEAFLMKGKAVSNYTGTVKVDGKEYTVHINNSLTVGDRVAMIRGNGGQTFYIFDKL